MNLEVSKPGLTASSLRRPLRSTLYQGVFFVLLWPTLNLLVVSAILNQFGFLDSGVLKQVAQRLFIGFPSAYALILLVQHLLPVAFSEERFWPQWALHVFAFVLINQTFGAAPLQFGPNELPEPLILPTAYMFFQVSLYVVVKTLLIQRERYLAAQLNLRQAQINVLRSQSNPHFLFNTLNLLASEIGRDPENAQEIVYDLSDLLRDSMRAAEREFTTLEEELGLVRLYLSLQKKRFPERLMYEIDVEATCLAQRVPALLLQPIVENVVKHVVAKSSAATQLQITGFREEGKLTVEVRDNGPPVTALNKAATGGLRIVKETLELHYFGKASLAFQSDAEGTYVIIVLPERQEVS
ncbi:MAG: histidine kinase [Pseudomonadota bacterium]